MDTMPAHRDRRGGKTYFGFSGVADQAVNAKTNDATKADRQEKPDVIT